MTTDPLAAEELRTVLQNTDRLLPFIERFETTVMDGCPSETVEEQQVYRFAWELRKTIVYRNLMQIHNRSESPIETLFLTSVALLFWVRDPYSLFTPFGEDHWDHVIRALDHQKSGMKSDLTTKAGARDLFLEIVYTYLEGVFKPHLLTQVQLSEVPESWNVDASVKRRLARMRVDALLFVPFRRDRLLLVECDGYEYHKGKNSFTRDRQRDRLVKSVGFDVFRFSGPEIFHHPLESARELVDRVFDNWTPFAPDDSQSITSEPG